MNHQQEASRDQYPHGRGYGHDYMRGGEVNGGYGYSEREAYEKSRGELSGADYPAPSSGADVPPST
ncbi:MAG: hypothetical protein MNPFHGCM_00590 [Gemmatimonadaceae bacterium]|nr:hypothetical protein [Gemmatimonadaceae bacterium]